MNSRLKSLVVIYLVKYSSKRCCRRLLAVLITYNIGGLPFISTIALRIQFKKNVTSNDSSYYQLIDPIHKSALY